MAWSPIATGSSPLQPTRPGFPQSGAWFGAFVGLGDHTGWDRRTAVATFESVIGRKLAMERVYYFWDQPFPTADDEWSRDQGRTLVLDWSARLSDQSTYTRWADIADGLYDDLIDQRAAALAAFGAPVYFSFDHEPERWVDKEGDPKAGTTEDFVRAWQHIHDRFVADGATNVIYVLTLIARTYTLGNQDLYDPGDAYVDYLGADGYNWHGCPSHDGPWLSFKNVFAEFHSYGVARGKPMMILEYGSQEDPAIPDRKAQWFADEGDTLKSWPEVKAVLYFDSAPPGGCEWWADSTPLSLAGFVALGADPYLNPPLPGSSPTARITSAPDLLSTSTSATFAFSSDDPHATFTCSLDYAAAANCSSGKTYTGLAEAPHVFSVAATDGGTVGDAALWAWTVDVPPSISIDSGPADPTFERSATFAFSSDDPLATFTCSLDDSPEASCSSPVTYDSLTVGQHSFSVRAFDGQGAGSDPAEWRWTVARVGGTVTATDFQYQPLTLSLALGTGAQWTFDGPSDHSATDASGMGLFDSGVQGPGGSFAFVFGAAGTYRYSCTVFPAMRGTVAVPLRAPPRANVGVPFTVRVASDPAPPGFAYDVQLKRPGSSWEDWKIGLTSQTATYTAGETGVYRFRSRLRLVGGDAAAYSPPAAVEVR